MNKLTRYNSFEALKASTTSHTVSYPEVEKKFGFQELINFFRNYKSSKEQAEPGDPDNSPTNGR